MSLVDKIKQKILKGNKDVDSYIDNESISKDKDYLEEEERYEGMTEDEKMYMERKQQKEQTKEEREKQVQSYFEEELTLEEIEAREYRQAKRDAIQAKKRKEMQDRIDFVESFTRPTMVFGFLIFYVANVFYLYLLTGQLAFSVMIGLYGAYVLSKWFIFKEYQVEKREEDLKALERLATDISFESQTGKNVYHTLESLLEKGTYTGRVGADVQYTYNVMSRDTELDLSGFESYEFTPFNLYLRNISIWYTEGVPVRDLLNKSIDIINFHLVQRETLRQRNKRQLVFEMTTIGLSLAIPLAIRFITADQYEVMLGKPIPTAIIVLLFYVGQLKVISMLKRNALDISIE